MGGYFGTQHQQHLQRRVDELSALVASTPGLCNAGRMVSSDDIDHVGFDTVLKMLEVDGGFGFRLVRQVRTSAITELLAARGYRLDWWDTFMAGSDTALDVSKRIVAPGPPPGFEHINLSGIDPDRGYERVQAFLVANGIAPFSGSMLAGEWTKAKAFALVDDRQEIVATSFAYMPHNVFSRFRGFAWAGLVAVSPVHRGKQLGTYINACAVAAAFTELGASTVYEQVSATNTASRRMVEASGLTLHPDLKSGLASTGTDIFTR
jgi:hypothetical protein